MKIDTYDQTAKDAVEPIIGEIEAMRSNLKKLEAALQGVEQDESREGIADQTNFEGVVRAIFRKHDIYSTKHEGYDRAVVEITRYLNQLSRIITSMHSRLERVDGCFSCGNNLPPTKEEKR